MISYYRILKRTLHHEIPPFRCSDILSFIQPYSTVQPFCRSTIPPVRQSASPPVRHSDKSAIPPFHKSVKRNRNDHNRIQYYCMVWYLISLLMMSIVRCKEVHPRGDFLLVRAAPKLTKTQNKSPQFIIFGQKRLLHHFYHLRQTYISSRNLGRK